VCGKAFACVSAFTDIKMEKIKKFFNYFEEICAGTFLIATTVLVIINVFTRYFLKTAIFWSEEVATGCFVWSVFLGAAAAYKRKVHVSVDMVVNLAKGKARVFIAVIMDLLLILVNGYIAYMALRYVKVSHVKPTPVLGISSVCISASILIAFTLMTIYSVKFFIFDFIKMTKQGDTQ
jgi:dicarboxylate:H+ TRAP-T family tripartite ATP-independent transporter, membrane protein small subunit